MRAEFKTKCKIIKTRVNAILSFKYLYGNGLTNRIQKFKLQIIS